MPGARYYWADGKWLPLIAEKWEMQAPDKFIMNVRKGLTWSDGKPVTAKDVVATFNILPAAQVARSSSTSTPSRRSTTTRSSST